MTLHWWMHWFWITRSTAVLLALLLAIPTVDALPVGPYTLPTQQKVHEQIEANDGSSFTGWPLEHSEELLQAGHRVAATYNADLWVSTQDLYHSTTSSIREPGISSAVLWPTGSTLSTVSVSDVQNKEIVGSSSKAITETSTYLHSGNEQFGLSGAVTPVVFYTSGSHDGTSVSDSHVFLYPTVTDEHVFPAVSNADNSQLANSGNVGKQSVVSDGDENVPVKKSTIISEIHGENQKFHGIKETTVSINGVPKIMAAEDNSSVVISSKDMRNGTRSLFNSSESVSSDSSIISLDPMIDTLNSHSQGMDKPTVNIPRIITRDLKNNSESSLNMSSPISILASQAHDQEDADHHSPLSLPELTPPNARAGKSAGYFPSQPLLLHPLVLSTISPSKDGPDAFPFPPSSDMSDIVHDFAQSYKLGPKSSDEFLNPRHVEAAIKDLGVSEHEEGDSRVTWISKILPISGITPEHIKMVPAAGAESSDDGNSRLGDVEMADSPYNPPESSTITGSRERTLSDDVSKPPAIPSSELVLPTEKAVDEDPDHPPAGPKGRSKEILKVIPPLMTSSMVVNTSSQSGRQSDNRTKSGHVPPVVSENTDRNTSVGSATENADSTIIIGEIGGLPADTKSSVLAVASSVSGVKQDVTPAAKDVEENETTVVTVLPTVVPVSNGRIAAAAPGGSHHGLDAASITGISLGILVFAALVGAVSFVLYRRRFLNKPQTLNDKCSNPDSSGYIDDSTLRENSEEMYSLDNDSFLNSLEAMTIQNYWTDNVKHTKL